MAWCAVRMKCGVAPAVTAFCDATSAMETTTVVTGRTNWAVVS